MKNTQKKLKAKHFRYLSKREIKDPLSYLDELYRNQTDFISFRKEVDLFLQSGLDPRLRIDGMEYCYTAQLFIKQVELAYVIYVQGGIYVQGSPPIKLRSTADLYSYLRNTAPSPCLAIQQFFEWMSLNRWREEIDHMACIASISLKTLSFESHGDSLMIYTLGVRLVDALYQIYEDDGVELEFPEYIKLKMKDESEPLEPFEPFENLSRNFGSLRDPPQHDK